ncbi:MAG: hypothetical protein JNJ71_08265 [Rubrivivax sp.]|nr:hypothetical protein [Rubrivivax sp.]
MTTISIHRPATVAEPRGARWAAEAAWQFLSGASRLGQAWRAARVTQDRLSEAAAVRRLAVSWQDVDPRFAADLFAAADRHERQNGN